MHVRVRVHLWMMGGEGAVGGGVMLPECECECVCVCCGVGGCHDVALCQPTSQRFRDTGSPHLKQRSDKQAAPFTRYQRQCPSPATKGSAPHPLPKAAPLTRYQRPVPLTLIHDDRVRPPHTCDRVWSRPKGKPRANTVCPTCSPELHPRVTGCSSLTYGHTGRQAWWD